MGLDLVIELNKPPSRPEERTLPVSEISGVEVKSHPFEEMLQADPGESFIPPIARLAPDDHGLLYFSSSSALRSFLDGGVDFLFRFSSVFDENSLELNLRSRYLRALGVDEPWLLSLLASDSVKDVGLIFPDLYFADGTDIAVILSISDWQGIQPLLEKAGTVSVLEKPVTVDTGVPGEQAHWATRDDYLLISTSRALLDRLLDPIETKGKGHLAQSAEFQYMLGQLPINDQTQAYLYLSDPFIRHLVGPRAKIGKLRRMQARSQMEFLTAAALLYRLDGHPQNPTVAQLRELGYVSRSAPQKQYRLTEGSMTTSDQFGSPAHLSPLSANPVDDVTRGEADAYSQYVRRYSEFWRQFFDPIAFRLDQTDGQSYELTTFILPLLDSELYDEAREVVTPSGGTSGFQTPALNPSPVLLLSVNLSDQQRLQLAKKLTEALTEFTSVDPAIFDSFGTVIHLAVRDSNPLIALGTGDILGAFGSDSPEWTSDSFQLPLLASVLTRPCDILIELEDADKVLRFLEQAGKRRFSTEARGNFFRMEDRNEWIYNLKLFELMQLRVGVRVEHGYLILSNFPWTRPARVETTRNAPLNGASLRLNLQAVDEQRPALFMTTSSEYRAAAFEGIGYLYPLLASGLASSVQEAEKKHGELFGFRPVHPAGGQWIWQDGELSSNMFGPVENPAQPSYQEGAEDIGLFKALKDLEVSMQFEETGLRTKTRWTTRAEP